MRIVHVVETLERGGLERVVVDLCEGQRAAGHDVSVLCVFRLGQLAAELSAAGIPVQCAAKRQGLDVRAIWRLRAFLKRSRADVVHAHNAAATYLVALAGTLLGHRHVLLSTRHGMGEVHRGSRKERLFGWAARRCQAMVTVCEAARRQFLQAGLVSADRVVVICNGIRTNEIIEATSATRLQARQLLGLSPDEFVVGSVGRLNWAKDYSLLIAAFGGALSQARATLVLVGDGGEKASLQAAAAGLGLAERVRFLGDRSDVRSILPAFDVFCLSSKTEGYSIALLEAATAGLPLVATDVGGNGEIVRPGITGLLVPVADERAFTTALQVIWSDAEQRGQLARAARHWAQQHAGVQAMVDSYLQLYARLLKP